MHPIVYDVSMLAGVLMVSVGAGLVWGLGPALMTAGACTMGLTYLGARG